MMIDVFSRRAKPKKTKVTFLLNDDLLKYLKARARGDNLTEKLTSILEAWRFLTTVECVDKMSNEIKEKPLKLKKVKRSR